MKIGLNSLCPCGSRQKYKKCCKILHNGANAKTALSLMKSRYTAFVLNDCNYIIKTTHTQNCDYTEDIEVWKASISHFSTMSDFKKLEILDFIETSEESFVTFKATIYQNSDDISFIEKSRFLKEQGRWVYHSGVFLDA